MTGYTSKSGIIFDYLSIEDIEKFFDKKTIVKKCYDHYYNDHFNIEHELFNIKICNSMIFYCNNITNKKKGYDYSNYYKREYYLDKLKYVLKDNCKIIRKIKINKLKL